MKASRDLIFVNADQELVPYDGSPLSWRVSAYAVVLQGDEVLIIKNRLEKLYDIIGGGLEFGETIEEALRREALEEAGAKLQVGELLKATTGWFYSRNGKYYQTVQLCYKAELVGELQQSTEADTEWKGFVPLTSIGKEYRLPPFAEAVIQEHLKAT